MKIDSTAMAYLTELSNQTGILATQCFDMENTVAFLVKPEDVSRAIGKQGAHVKILSQKFRKKVEIYEDSPELEIFLSKALRGAKIRSIDIEENNGEKTLNFSVDSETKSNLLNNSQKIRTLKEILNKKYGIKNMKVK